jgi:quinoprotein glucose dehydrogenase
MTRFLIFCLALLIGPSTHHRDSCPSDEWCAYGRDAGGSRYSPLRRIDKTNVQQLKVAWTYHTHALDVPSRLNAKAAFEDTPLFVNGLLYVITPFNRVIALNADTGQEIWSYDPAINRDQYFNEVTSRGVSYWAEPKPSAAECNRRIIIGTLDARLIALDAMNGKPCADFGVSGQVDLKEGISIGPDRGQFQETSPPAIVANVIVVGSSIGDNRRVQTERGIVRGYDARTGRLAWTWDPLPGNVRYGAANAWGAIAADPERDMVFVPTGSPSPDFYGGEREGDDRDGNSLVALRASTGEPIWRFQVVHHDTWDYDIAAQPSLVTVIRNGKPVPAVAVSTKTAFLYLLDRLTGKPLLPVVEKPVPQSDVPGEKSWPTQPFTDYPALASQGLRPEEAWGLTEEDRQWCHDRIASLRSEGIFTPPSLRGTVQLPGQIGGVSWGGAAVDPMHGWLIVNTTRLAMVIQLIPRDEYNSLPKQDSRRLGDLMPQDGTPYALFRDVLRSPHGLPCNPPPWGTLAAIDLRSGRQVWEIPLGKTVIPAASPEGTPIEIPGAPILGGPLVTAGNLVFIASARGDTTLRAFDLTNGMELWQASLPAGGHATPMTYATHNGKKQYVVICAGGHGKFASKQGDYVIAYSLP